MNASTISASPYRNSQLTGWHSVGAWAISLSYLLFCISDTLLSLEMDGSQLVKLGAFALLSTAILLRPSFHKLIALILPILITLYLAMWRSFNINAGGEEFLRFLAPMAITVSMFAYRSRLSPAVFMFFAVVLSNDLFQCYFYLAYVLKLPLFLPVKFDSGLYLRAQGWIGFFSEFSFINFCAFLLCRHYRPTRWAKRAAWIFLVFALLGVSFKIFATIAVYFVVERKLTVRSVIAAFSVIGVVLLALMSGLLDSLIKIAMTKLSFYVVAGNSARAESYRVMFESLMKGNFFGEGLGSFGGPASVKYHSPLYSIYHFNWYGLGNTLTTTDTFYPHLFVELGVLGAILWLVFMVLYGQIRRSSRIWLFLVGAFCFDNIFSMSFVSASYVFPALMLMYLFSQNNNSLNRASLIVRDRHGVLR